jgi:predicted flavoprotein YhiN
MLSIVMAIAPLLIGKLADAFSAYEKKQISLAELNAKVSEALMDCFSEVMKSQSDALAKTFASFGQIMINSRLVRIVWATVVISQLGVLLWLQVGISALLYYHGGHSWPSAGATGDWAYLLVAGLLGLGPVVLNSGPGKVNLDSLKKTVG